MVNAFHLTALKQMADLAARSGKDVRSGGIHRTASASARGNFNRELWMRRQGSLSRRRSAAITRRRMPVCFRWPSVWCRRTASRRVTDYLVKRGMTCSVYAAQYLMEGLFQSGADDAALALITAPRRPQLAAHAGKRHHHHLGGVGPEIQAEPGLEPRVGSRSGQPVSTLPARCDARGAWLEIRAHRPQSRRTQGGPRAGFRLLAAPSKSTGSRTLRSSSRSICQRE